MRVEPVAENLRVHMRHVRTAKLCGPGSRNWARARGLDWNQFVHEGLPAETLRATGDPFALRAVAVAEEEARHGG